MIDFNVFSEMLREYEEVEEKFCKSFKGCKKCPLGTSPRCAKLFGTDYTEQLSADKVLEIMRSVLGVEEVQPKRRGRKKKEINI